MQSWISTSALGYGMELVLCSSFSLEAKPVDELLSIILSIIILISSPSKCHGAIIGHLWNMWHVQKLGKITRPKFHNFLFYRDFFNLSKAAAQRWMKKFLKGKIPTKKPLWPGTLAEPVGGVWYWNSWDFMFLEFRILQELQFLLKASPILWECQ